VRDILLISLSLSLVRIWECGLKQDTTSSFDNFSNYSPSSDHPARYNVTYCWCR